MGAATLNQPASLRASDAWSSERATRIGATRASLAAVGGVGGGGGDVLARGSDGWDAAVSERRARGAAVLTRPWHTEETRGERSGGAGIAETDPTAPSYRLTRWRRRPHTSPARDTHWLPPQSVGVVNPPCPLQSLLLVKMLLQGRNSDRQQTAIRRYGRQSRRKTETACGGGGGRE